MVFQPKRNRDAIDHNVSFWLAKDSETDAVAAAYRYN